jgi:hypothetical protein
LWDARRLLLARVEYYRPAPSEKSRMGGFPRSATRPRTSQSNHWRNPSSLVVLDAGGGEGLRERLVLWHPGTIVHWAIEGRTLAFVGVNNRVDRKAGARYRVAVGLVDLGPVGDGRGPIPMEATAPVAVDDPGRGLTRCFILPLEETKGAPEVDVLEFEGNRWRVPLDSGLVFLVDPASGRLSFECTDAYRGRFEAALPAGGTTLDDHLRSLEKAVMAWPGKP